MDADREVTLTSINIFRELAKLQYALAHRTEHPPRISRTMSLDGLTLKTNPAFAGFVLIPTSDAPAGAGAASGLTSSSKL